MSFMVLTKTGEVLKENLTLKEVIRFIGKRRGKHTHFEYKVIPVLDDTGQ